MNTVELQILLNDVYQPVDIDKGTSFAFNLQAEDLNNPTMTRVSFSVPVSLPKTHTNNHIFSQIWKLDSTISNFNPLLRTDFRLYVNYNIFQSGYLQLEEITRKEYRVRLFGGLNDYFFTLSEIPLRELGYKDSQRTAFGEKYTHTINKETVSAFWKGADVRHPATDPNGQLLNPYFSYAMTYQGKYDNFDSESYIENDDEPIQVIWENDIKQFNAPDVNEHKMRYHTPLGDMYWGEYRSYYQKPMMRVREVIEQMFEVMKTEHGWETALDATFFNNYNPYWNDVWMILPNYDSAEEQAAATSKVIELYREQTNEVQQKSGRTVIAEIPLSGLPAEGITGNNSIDINLDFKVKAVSHTAPSDNARQVKTGANANILTCFAFLLGPDGKELEEFRIRAEDDELYLHFSKDSLKDYYPKKIYSGSNIGGQDFYYTYSDTRGDMTEEEAHDGTTVYSLKMLRSIDTSDIQNYSIRIYVQGDTNWNRTNDGQTLREYGVKLEFQESAYVSVLNDVGTGIRTDAEVSWEDMITSDENCVNFLLSYAKLFDLYFVKDTARKYVSIQTRNTYFREQERRDWTYKVDYSKDFVIKPVPFEYRYGVFKWKENDTRLENEYLNRTSRDYGSIRFDTNYGFSDTEKDLLSTIFNNVVMATDNSAYYFEKSETIYQDNKTLPFFEDSSREGVEISFALVFYRNRFLDTGSLPFVINDDIGVMTNYGYSWGNTVLPQTPSFLLQTAYPEIDRTINKASQDHSLDFGRPQFRYYRDTSESGEMEGATPVTLYERFWRGYLLDRFNEQTKQLTCYITLGLNDVYEDLFNKFIFINDTVWVIIRIHNYDPNQRGPVKVDLISVQSMDAYISQVFLAGRLIIRYGGVIVYNSESENPSLNSTPVQIETSNPDAHTEQIALDFDPQMDWTIYSDQPITPTSGNGNSNVTITLPDNTSSADVIYDAFLRWGNSNTLIQFIQQGLFIEVTPTWTSTDASLKLLQITVTSNSAWSVSSNQSWLIPDSASGSGNRTVVAAINGNTSPDSRTGVITFTMVKNPSITATSTIVQAGAVEPETISVSPEEETVSSAVQNVLVTVTASASWRINIIGDSSWFEISPTSGTGNATVQITIPERNVGPDREVYIDFVLDNGDGVARFELTQLGGN